MVTEIVTSITSAFTGLLTGLGTGIVEVFDGLVLTTEGKLTTFAAWGLAFLGVGLAIAIYKSLCRKVG